MSKLQAVLAAGLLLSTAALVQPDNGKAEVAAAWQRFFVAKGAPFSWEPDQVVVTADGLLAHSTGPVRDPSGKPIARFNSVWRLEGPGVWRIVFDKGEAWEEPPK